ARVERGFLQRDTLVIRLVSDRSGLVVADDRAQRGHQHERAAQHLVDVCLVEPRPFHREPSERIAGIAKDAGGVKEVVDDDGAHGIEFEIALAAGDRDRIIFADYLDADHHHRLALSRVYLAWHDGRARLVLWQEQL